MNFKRMGLYASGKTLKGKVEFENELGEITLNLDEQMAQEILTVCADALVRVSKQASEEMTAQVLDALPVAALMEAGGSDEVVGN